MKSKFHLIWLVALIVMPGLFGAVKGGGLELWDVPKFNGYIGIGNDVRFALTPYAIDGKPANLSWVRIGEKLGAYEIVAFDPKTQVLKLRKPGFESVDVRLPESVVRNAALGPVMSRAEAKQYAFDLVATFLKSVREEHPERNVTVNPDLALMPDERRARFLETQQKIASAGQILTPFVLPDGRWGQVISSDEVKKLPREISGNLTADDRREINAAWALARTEALARGIPPRLAKSAN